MENNLALLKIKNLTFSRNIKRAYFETVKSIILKNITFSINRGQTIGILGESGSGKTTLLHLIQGLLAIQKGSIFIDGKNISEMNLKEHSLLSQIIFQNVGSCFNPRYTVKEILEEPIIIHKLNNYNNSIINEVLDLVKISNEMFKKRPKDLSGGQLQRINIARALMLKPKLLLCDEIVSALDLSIQAQVLNTLNDIQKIKKMSIIFVSHDINVINHMSDYIYVLKDGVIYDEFDDLHNSNNLKPFTLKLISNSF